MLRWYGMKEKWFPFQLQRVEAMKPERAWKLEDNVAQNSLGLECAKMIWKELGQVEENGVK